jgi:hypothetical protein
MSLEDDHEKLIRDLICDKINLAITAYEEALPVAQGSGSGARRSELPVIYTEATKHLFYRAWLFAALLRHREVNVDHVLTALISGADATLPDSLTGDPIVPLTGALVRIAILEPIAGDQTIKSLRPSANLVRWVREANKLATIRDGAKRLDTSDLISVYSGTGVDQSVRGMLQRIVRLAESAGNSRVHLARIWKEVENIDQTTSRHKSESGKSFDEVKPVITATHVHTSKLADLSTAVDACRNQLAEVDRRTAEIEDAHLPGLVATVDACQDRLAALDRRAAEIRDIQLAGLTEAVGDCRNQLSELDRRTAAIGDGLPRAPATLWLLLGVVVAVGLGLGVGIVLRDTSLLEEVVKLARVSLPN